MADVAPKELWFGTIMCTTTPGKTTWIAAAEACEAAVERKSDCGNPDVAYSLTATEEHDMSSDPSDCYYQHAQFDCNYVYDDFSNDGFDGGFDGGFDDVYNEDDGYENKMEPWAGKPSYFAAPMPQVEYQANFRIWYSKQETRGVPFHRQVCGLFVGSKGSNKAILREDHSDMWHEESLDVNHMQDYDLNNEEWDVVYFNIKGRMREPYAPTVFDDLVTDVLDRLKNAAKRVARNMSMEGVTPGDMPFKVIALPLHRPSNEAFTLFSSEE